ncbi:uncharacterized protein LOC108442560 [Pygocentrus nattereri]|uniref:uncharacterized protein LOC108442560 n=1 Tax=Pygocentrus nattereri TaxID=42514 RepID=UPI0008142209|nr:uncharacterized protein LOC108442560 [Pygocentrus nattereri]XP_017578143.1 uncharacterized protein LOC108442560 [Pygocentrus nattereri]XP_037396214.1 uncharacterized protein LOC108442560 [Pygocentrus nattereri]
MATKETQRAEEDSTDSDDSNSGGRPSFSAEERPILDKVLRNSNDFIRSYEEHQPELQRIINQQFKHTEEILDHYNKITEAQRRLRGAAVSVGFGLSLGIGAFATGVSLFPDDDDFSLPAAGLGALAAVFAGIASYKIKQRTKETKNLLENSKNISKHLNTVAEEISSYQKKLCNLAERNLQLINKFPLQKHEKEDIRKQVDALLELVKVFRPEDVLRLLEEKSTLDWRKNTEQFVSPVPFISEGSKTKPASKTKRGSKTKQGSVQLQAEQLDWEMREVKNHLQRILKETRTSNLEIERVMQKLNEHIKQ